LFWSLSPAILSIGKLLFQKGDLLDFPFLKEAVREDEFFGSWGFRDWGGFFKKPLRWSFTFDFFLRIDQIVELIFGF